MHLYLRSSDFTTEVPAIGLQDGFLPVIGTQRLAALDDDLQIEPAVWFKVQVIDAVSIDCTKRAILWNSSTVFDKESEQVCGPSSPISAEDGADHSAVSEGGHSAVVGEGSSTLLRKSRHRGLGSNRKISESMYIGGECYGYQSDLDELFDTAQELLSKYACGEMSSTTMNESLFKLLHCYILPAIKLTADDLVKVNAAYAAQEDAVQVVDAAILEKNKEIEKLKRAMKVQREKHFLPLPDEGKAAKYQLDFVRTLQEHVDGDIQASYEELERLQAAVEQARSGAGCELAARRTERDAHFLSYEKLISCRETLRNLTSKVGEKRKSSRLSKPLREKVKKIKNGGKSARTSSDDLDILQNVYLGMVEEVLQRDEELRTLAHKKVLVISVKEAIRMTMKQLQSGGDTFGVDIDKTGRIKATDVLRHSNIPKAWQTLTEQVSGIVADTENPVGYEHQVFCHTVQEQCTALLSEKRLFYMCQPSSKAEQSLAESCISLQKLLNTQSECSNESESKIRTGGSSCGSKMGTVNAGTDTEGLPQVRPMDLLPHGRKGIACFPLPGHSSFDKTRNSNGESSDVDSCSCWPSRPASNATTSSSSHSTASDVTDPTDSYVIVHDSEHDYSRKLLMQIKQNIHQHIAQTCSSVQATLGYTDSAYYRKIWLCYETLLYENLMPHLVELYERTFSSVSSGLQKLLPLMTVEELDIGNSVVLRMLKGKHHSLGTTATLQRDEHEHVVSLGLERTSPGKASPTSPPFSLPGETDAESPESGAESFASTSGLSSPKKDGCGQSHHLFANSGGSTNGTEAKLNGGCQESDPSLTNSPPSPTSVQLRTIKIHHPSKVTVLYDRQTWPLQQRVVPLTENVEHAVEALGTIGEGNDLLESVKTAAPPLSPRSPTLKEVIFKPRFKQHFALAFRFVEGAISEKSPLLKLQHLTACLREISQQISTIHQQMGTQISGACTDDLIDILVILLCNCSPDLVARIYPHIMLLTDLMPPFFEGGPYSFSLVQFSVALEFLQDRLVMKRRLS